MVVSLPEKMVRKFIGGKEKEERARKNNFKKKVLSCFFRHYESKNGVCAGRCMCSRNHRGKKVI